MRANNCGQVGLGLCDASRENLSRASILPYDGLVTAARLRASGIAPPVQAPAQQSDEMHFNIVTPVFNGAAYLDETIYSVVGQSGDFSITYHVQDGGSTDGTLELLAKWAARLKGDFPIRCRGVEFSFSSAPDKGLYDAVNRGFEACGPADVMAWINADDLFQPGAFNSVAQIFTRFADIDWVTGRPNVMDESGATVHISSLIPFPRQALAAGIFDGRFACHFVQQEGTFWRQSLWKKAGGLNADFRLAGDLDLWRRFARHADLVMANVLFGCFRTRPGQLSGNIDAYRAEFDAALTPDEVRARARAARRYKHAGFDYRVLVRHYMGPWTCERWPMALIPVLGYAGFPLEWFRLCLHSFLIDRTFPRKEKNSSLSVLDSRDANHRQCQD